tara:strand:- start:288 stop:428 length:141 start_codon:yes stop_codon:yes gene_type:complete
MVLMSGTGVSGTWGISGSMAAMERVARGTTVGAEKANEEVARESIV